MALNADQLTVGTLPPPEETKSDLQLLRESLTGKSEVKVINNLNYEVVSPDPFKIKKKRSVEELLLINELKKQNTLPDSSERGLDDELLSLQQAREIARLRQELEELNKYKASLNIQPPESPPDWTIEREVEGSFNKLRSKLAGIEINDSYDKETPIFIVDRKEATEFNNIRNRSLVGGDTNSIISVDNVDQYYAEKRIKEEEQRESAIAAYNQRLLAEHEAEVLRLAKLKLDKNQELKLQAIERDKEIQELIEARQQQELEIQRAALEQKQRVADEKVAAAKQLEDLVLSKISGPQRPHLIKKIKSAATNLIEYKSSAFNSDMLSSYKD